MLHWCSSPCHIALSCTRTPSCSYPASRRRIFPMALLVIAAESTRLPEKWTRERGRGREGFKNILYAHKVFRSLQCHTMGRRSPQSRERREAHNKVSLEGSARQRAPRGRQWHTARPAGLILEATGGPFGPPPPLPLPLPPSGWRVHNLVARDDSRRQRPPREMRTGTADSPPPPPRPWRCGSLLSYAHFLSFQKYNSELGTFGIF